MDISVFSLDTYGLDIKHAILNRTFNVLKECHDTHTGVGKQDSNF